MASKAHAATKLGIASPNHSASTMVAIAPTLAFANTTCPGSRSATPRESVLSMPHATVAINTASSPANWVSPAKPCSKTKAIPPANRNNMAAPTRLSMVSPYSRQANKAVNSASKVSMSEALDPLVRCKPQAKATGPMTAPNAAIAAMRGQSARRKAASRCGGWRISSATTAAPIYSSAAVVKAPKP